MTIAQKNIFFFATNVGGSTTPNESFCSHAWVEPFINLNVNDCIYSVGTITTTKIMYCVTFYGVTFKIMISYGLKSIKVRHHIKVFY